MTPQSLHRLLVESTELLTSQQIVEKITNELEYRLGSVSEFNELRTQYSTMCSGNKPYNRSIETGKQQIQSSTRSYSSVDASE